MKLFAFYFAILLATLFLHSYAIASENKIENCLVPINLKGLNQRVRTCEKELVEVANSGEKQKVIQIYLRLIELFYRQEDGASQDYYLAKLKSDQSFLEKIEHQYLWNRYAGKRFFRANDYLLAKPYFRQGLNIAIAEKNIPWLSHSYNDVGLIELKLNDFKNSLDHYKKSLMLKLQLGDAYSIAKTLINIGSVHTVLEEYEEAISYYKRAHQYYLKYATEHQNSDKIVHSITHLYEYLADAYVKSGDLNKAKNYFDKIVISIENQLNTRQQSRILTNLATVLNGQSEYIKARGFLLKALGLKTSGSFDHRVDIYYQLSVTYNQLQQSEKAIELLNKGLVILEAHRDNVKKADYHQRLAMIYEAIDPANALFHFKRFQYFRENFLQTKYHSDIKTIQHELVQKRITANLVAEKLKTLSSETKFQVLVNWSLLVVILLILTMSFTVFYFFRNTKKQEALTQSINFHKQQLLLLENEKESQQHCNDPIADKFAFKQLLVNTMIETINIWEIHTQSNKIELAEKSRLWTVSIDGGSLRTRSLDKYLSIDKIPNNPKWKNVVGTCHFILSDSLLTSEHRAVLTQNLELIMSFVKSLSLQPKY